MIQLGDYVLASHYADADPQDPWRIGFVCQIVWTWGCEAPVFIIGNADKTWNDMRAYRHARKITKDVGQEWLDEYGESG